AVGDVAAAGARLRLAGMAPVAASGSAFAFFRTSGGVLVRVIDDHLVPPSRVNQSPAAIDLGPVGVVTYYPCDPASLKRGLASVVGSDWRPTQQFTLPYVYPDGTSQAFDITVDATVAGAPFVSIESPIHTHEQGSCSASRTPLHLVYFADDVVSAAQQL